MSAHYVYRAYSADMTLLYVGCTSDLFKRIGHHKAVSFWAPECTKFLASVHPSKTAAHAVERDLIKRLGPRFNVVGRFSDRQAWGEQQYLDLLLALRNCVSPLGPSIYQARRIESITRELANRFPAHQVA